MSDLVEKVARAIMDTQDMGNVDAQAKAAIAVVLKDLLRDGWDEDCLHDYARDNGVNLDE